ncbi:hypothetical protein [Escherichia phage BF17]|jgi:hypothetical protein|uniref:Transcription regulator n=1 Tax=Escherichia phage fEgEco12 TaxID=3158837 RepID=A0AAU7PIS1_9CAUD|nr:hypothetical protein [Escherichia coli]QAY00416.1 structural protein [Escherichia phage Ecwhy_1]QXN76364.1 hypothetical protein [Escherichia phage BF17]WGM49619.1 virion structural protein [Escherichia phage vB_Ec-M-J]VVY06376.1 Uncharacterised protein [Escherichia coli]
MRTVPNVHGHNTMVSNEEYRLLQKIKARGSVPVEKVNEYYQELADKMVSRGVLNIVEKDDGTEEYSTVRSNK